MTPIGYVLVCCAHKNGVGPFETSDEAQKALDSDPDGGSCKSEVIPIFLWKGQPQVQVPFSLN